ncbi:MAG TPA: hypothetical protein VER96_05995 [Polyangiaceae bacterium]|nr:hypothetical protein [Polyangiaceae bacterium]
MKIGAVLFATCLCFGCSLKRDHTANLGEAARSTEASTKPSPNEALDKLDQRRPVPLLPMMAQHQKENMREHLQAVQGVIAAAAVGDFDKAAESAKRMGSSETMGRMCERMGAGATGFTEQALAFHHTADEIVAAAGKRDSSAMLSALSKTLSACTNCHATFKQQIVASLQE